jgi:hypothetical protein
VPGLPPRGGIQTGAGVKGHAQNLEVQIVPCAQKRIVPINQRSEDFQVIDWFNVYGKKPQEWKVHSPHCKHCYREGFFDAGVTGLMIIVALILAYGVEMMK